MADPVTVGAWVVSALTMAAEAAAKSVLGDAAKDAYKALKERIVAWAGHDVEELEQAPGNANRQALVASEIDARPPAEQEEARALAVALLGALQAQARQSPVGIDIGRLEAARVQLGAITVTEGTGFRAAEVVTPGDFTADHVTVGVPEGKAPR
ncbi:MAG: hypothetical protein K2X71_08830 [Methylobacterium sp.]|uniref:hypothetical protein n=1 Tax=Methylobacterium sp. TaxID=409 RepID=UPI00258488C2|nr:hypothetical protein [Methylobacterium sp.]MBY0296130.1 hypothetical protein [Methylobacterium sp.]